MKKFVIVKMKDVETFDVLLWLPASCVENHKVLVLICSDTVHVTVDSTV